MRSSVSKCGFVGAVALALVTSVATAQAGVFGPQQPQLLNGEGAVTLARVGGGGFHGGGMGGHGGHGFGGGHSFHGGHFRGFGVSSGPYYWGDTYDEPGCRWSPRYHR